MRRTLLAAALLVCACKKPPPPAPPPPDPRIVLRDRARLVLERMCGECHIGTLPTALPRALAVYDLMQPEWSAKMNPTQLRDLVERISGTLIAGPRDGKINDATDAEKATIRAFVAGELAHVDGDL